MDERTRKSSGTTRQMQNKSTTQRTRSAQMVRIGREEMVHQGDGENAIWRSR